MSSSRVIAVSLSVVLGTFLLLCLAKLCYLLCLRRARSKSRVINVSQEGKFGQGENSVELIGDADVVAIGNHLSLSSTIQAELLAKVCPVNNGLDSEDSRIDYLLGSLRMLFTIKEETKDDLESEGAKSKHHSRPGSQESGELISHISSEPVTPLETPFVTPPMSPLPSLSDDPPLSTCMRAFPSDDEWCPRLCPFPTSPVLTPMNTVIPPSLTTFSIPLATPPLTPLSASPSRPSD